MDIVNVGSDIDSSKERLYVLSFMISTKFYQAIAVTSHAFLPITLFQVM